MIRAIKCLLGRHPKGRVGLAWLTLPGVTFALGRTRWRYCWACSRFLDKI